MTPKERAMSGLEGLDRLEAIRKRAEEATPGPWEAPLKDLGAIPSFAAVDFFFDHSFEAYPPLGEAGPVFVAPSVENADFIAHAREDVPWLLGEVSRLRERVKELEGEEVTGVTGRPNPAVEGSPDP